MWSCFDPLAFNGMKNLCTNKVKRNSIFLKDMKIEEGALGDL